MPDGTFAAHPARGGMMGNRGVLHDAGGRLGPARWRHRNWVCCVLSFKGRRRRIMAPGRYTELFFLDEATALAAGHRPCAECRRADYDRWCAAWARAFGAGEAAAAMDARLHAARAVPGARRLRHDGADADDLPEGAMFAHGGRTFLKHGRAALPFAPDGYGDAVPLPVGMVAALTNAVARAVIAAGYVPALDATALDATA